MSAPQVPVWKVHPHNPDAQVISRVASVILNGGVVIYPTETLYGLGAHPESESAVERVYGIKNREWDKPLPLIASDMKAVERAVSQWPQVAQRLARAFWPGPLTLVLPASPHFPPMLHAGTGKIALRISSHGVARSLADAVGGLLIATSANKAGEPPGQHPTDLPPSLLHQTDGILDAGRLSPQLPSTIVDISNVPHEPARLLRAGCLPWSEVVKVMLNADLG